MVSESDSSTGSDESDDGNSSNNSESVAPNGLGLTTDEKKKLKRKL